MKPIKRFGSVNSSRSPQLIHPSPLSQEVHQGRTLYRGFNHDELMIVNPSPPNPEAYFLGKDGTLYQMQGLGQEQAFQDREQYFLGEDNTLYQVQGLGQAEDLQGLGQYFLGEDGTLYQVQGIGFGESPPVPMKPHTCRCMRR